MHNISSGYRFYCLPLILLVNALYKSDASLKKKQGEKPCFIVVFFLVPNHSAGMYGIARLRVYGIRQRRNGINANCIEWNRSLASVWNPSGTEWNQCQLHWMESLACERMESVRDGMESMLIALNGIKTEGETGNTALRLMPCPTESGFHTR